MRSSITIQYFALPALALAASSATAMAGGQSAKLLPNDGAALDYFGQSVAIEGGIAAIGASGLPLGSGAVYLFETATGQQIAELFPDDGAAGDSFGWSVAMDGTTVLVGSYFDDDHGPLAGSAYLFDSAAGMQIAKLVSHDGADFDFFGASVGISGNVAVVGAPNNAHSGINSGSAYLFDTATGQEIAKLVPHDTTSAEHFGSAVAIDGSVVVIGAEYDDDHGFYSGSAYLFDATTTQQTGKLLAVDGAPQDNFGASVAIRGGIVVVGSPGDTVNGQQSGSAYLFDATTGQQIRKLVPNDGEALGSFGVSVAISGSTVVVGAAGDDHTGSVYLFDAISGLQIGKRRALDGTSGDALGISVAIDGSTLVAGAEGDDDNGDWSGSAYLFRTDQALAVPYCFGDGSGTPCPCGNSGSAGRGCANSAFAQGARLDATGTTSVSLDDLAFVVAGSRSGKPGLFFQGDDAVAGGLGTPFGDGLRCAGGNVRRLQIVAANGSGAASSTIPIASTAGVSPGETKRYQWWYRDPGASPCGSGFNLSNGVAVDWGS